MVKQRYTDWIAPVFVVVAIFAVYLSLTYLPLDSWGVSISGEALWSYLPWLILFVAGLFVLKNVYGRR